MEKKLDKYVQIKPDMRDLGIRESDPFLFCFLLSSHLFSLLLAILETVLATRN